MWQGVATCPKGKGSHALRQGVAVTKGRNDKGSRGLGQQGVARAGHRVGPTQPVKIAAGATRKFFLLQFFATQIFFYFL